MAKKAHGRLRRCDLDDVLGAFDEAREEREASSSFERQVAHSLTLCARVGNVYTGSLYLGLAGMLQEGAPALAGKRVGLFSYGSGCASEFFSGVVGAAAAERLQRAKLHEVIGGRQRITVDEYERLMALAPDAPQESPPSARWFPVHRDARAPPPVRGGLSQLPGFTGPGSLQPGQVPDGRLERLSVARGTVSSVARRGPEL